MRFQPASSFAHSFLLLASAISLATDPARAAAGDLDTGFGTRVGATSYSQALQANGRIAFASDRDGNREIYSMDPDGSNSVRLTNNPGLDDHPRWSPDGKQIAFMGRRAQGGYAIFVMNEDGTNRREVTSIAYAEPQSPDVFGWRHMSWSPDGRQIAFPDIVSGVSMLVVVNIDGTNRRGLTPGWYPDWSPDGSKILFVRAVPNGFISLHTIRPDGTDIQNIQIAFSNQGYVLGNSPPIWSPDGRRIMVNSTDTANSELNIVNANGSNPQLFTAICTPLSALGCGANTAQPAWSRNGREIMFAQWSFATSSVQIYRQRLDEMYPVTLTNAPGNNTSPSWQPRPKATFDFDADGRADISVFRPSNGTWYANRSSMGNLATHFGVASDTIVPADYDGDAMTDIAVFRNGMWWRLNSSDSTVVATQFGIAGDIPVPADYTGDGLDELAVFRNGDWWTLDPTNGRPNFFRWGLATDKPVAADYDGDGRTDPAVYRDGVWYLLRSQLGPAVVHFGLATDRPVVADYDGDGRADPTVFRDGVWYVLGSESGFSAFQFGITSDIPVSADYDGDGRTDAAVYRAGVWYVLKSTGGIVIQQFGLPGDRPIANAFLDQ